MPMAEQNPAEQDIIIQLLRAVMPLFTLWADVQKLTMQLSIMLIPVSPLFVEAHWLTVQSLESEIPMPTLDRAKQASTDVTMPCAMPCAMPAPPTTVSSAAQSLRLQPSSVKIP